MSESQPEEPTDFEAALAETQRRERAEDYADIARQQEVDDRVVKALAKDD